jgi:transmembrane sensor
MASFESRLARVRSHLGRPAWDDDRVTRNANGMQRKVRRRAQVRRVTMLAMVPLLVLAAFATRGGWSHHAMRRAAPTVARESRTLHFDDGATTVTLAPGSRVETAETTATRIVLRVTHGRASFDVAHREGRTFRVEAGAAAVQVLGTAFAVERAGEGARVSVESGRVRVFFGDRYADLGAGEEGIFPSAIASAAVNGDVAPTAERATDRSSEPSAGVIPPSPVRHEIASPTWRSFAAHGNYDEAYSALADAGFASVRDEVADLFTASDVARLSGHPSDAVAPLGRVLAHHGDDARAPLAAFTLGRVLLDDMGQAREAAAAFARIRGMSNAGALAEDALAREVEAWSRAGEIEQAHEAATVYLSRYPEGRAARRGRRCGGLP